jgi:hypothetical protein
VSNFSNTFFSIKSLSIFNTNSSYASPIGFLIAISLIMDYLLQR